MDFFGHFMDIFRDAMNRSEQNRKNETHRLVAQIFLLFLYVKYD